MPQVQNKQIDEITKRLKDEYDPEKIILFGSHARGEQEEWGDIDIIVIKEDERRFMERQRAAALFLEDIEEDIDIFVYTPSEWADMNEDYNPFAESIARNHQVLYEKE